ncbi:phosphatase PAP2 family protein [Streptomyces sp. enrichment culture]|uniref:phosphatase PAP2 family protein n=1 Tax=Streptomyces sp. enrichment culture TaxID=1795815 RepID=UPI003F54AED3
MSGQHPVESPEESEPSAVGGPPEQLDPRGLLRHLAPVRVPVPAGSEVRRHGERARRSPLVPLGAGLLASALVFAAVAYLVLTAEAGFLDRPLMSEAVRHRSAVLDGPMQVVSDVSELPLLVVSVLVALWVSWRAGSWLPVVLVGATGALAALASTAAKELTDRSRPPAKLWQVSEEGFGFPSRHTVVATAVLLVLAYVCAARLRSRAARLSLWTGAGVLCVLCGYSRVHLGVHWPTDVLAGLGLGAAVALLVVTAHAVRHRHADPTHG